MNQLTGDSGTTAKDFVQCLGVFIEIFHKLHLFAIFGETRVVNQLRSLENVKIKTSSLHAARSKSSGQVFVIIGDGHERRVK
jgi:hypothetical protein